VREEQRRIADRDRRQRAGAPNRPAQLDQIAVDAPANDRLLPATDAQRVPNQIERHVRPQVQDDLVVRDRQPHIQAVVVDVEPADRGLVPAIRLIVRPIRMAVLVVEDARIEHELVDARLSAATQGGRHGDEVVIRGSPVPFIEPLVAEPRIAAPDDPQLALMQSRPASRMRSPRQGARSPRPS
jgi:hypothetical protein